MVDNGISDKFYIIISCPHHIDTEDDSEINIHDTFCNINIAYDDTNFNKNLNDFILKYFPGVLDINNNIHIKIKDYNYTMNNILNTTSNIEKIEYIERGESYEDEDEEDNNNDSIVTTKIGREKTFKQIYDKVKNKYLQNTMAKVDITHEMLSYEDFTIKIIEY